MRKCIIIFGFLMMVFSAMADEEPNKYIQHLVMEMRDAIDNTDSIKLDSDAQQFVKSIENMSDDKINFFKIFFFSERLLWRVYDDYVAILDQKSQETGRKIVKSVSDDDKTSFSEYLELDTTGVADDKCLFQDNCVYPDGFEECMIELQEDGDMSDGTWNAELFISCDDKKTNLVNSINIIISADMKKNSGDFLVQVGGSESKYDKELEFRQNDANVRRYNAEQKKKYGKKAGYKKEEGFLPATKVYLQTFSGTYAG